jgi:hypothetical protein
MKAQFGLKIYEECNEVEVEVKGKRREKMADCLEKDVFVD